MVAEKYGGPWAETGALIRDHEIGASFQTGLGHLKTRIGDNYENSSGRHRNCIHRSAERGPEKVFRKTILLRTWSASSRRRRRMDSRFSSSPHYFYPADKGWKFNGPLEIDEVTSGSFACKEVLNLDGLEGSGADWLERFKPYIQDGKTIVVAPHRVFGPQTNDLVLQTTKSG